MLEEAERSCASLYLIINTNMKYREFLPSNLPELPRSFAVYIKFGKFRPQPLISKLCLPSRLRHRATQTCLYTYDACECYKYIDSLILCSLLSLH